MLYLLVFESYQDVNIDISFYKVIPFSVLCHRSIYLYNYIPCFNYYLSKLSYFCHISQILACCIPCMTLKHLSIPLYHSLAITLFPSPPLPNIQFSLFLSLSLNSLDLKNCIKCKWIYTIGEPDWLGGLTVTCIHCICKNCWSIHKNTNTSCRLINQTPRFLQKSTLIEVCRLITVMWISKLVNCNDTSIKNN